MKENTFTPVKNAFTMNQFSLLGSFLLVGCLFFAFTGSSSANSDRKNSKASETASTTTVCDVENFGKVNENYYRGAQPEEAQYAQLAALGVKTVVDLRDDPKGYSKHKAEASGLQYINLPMSDKRYPGEQDVKKFLELANDQANWPIYVHCAGGRHRTGAMTAVYRMVNENWDIEKAYAEMKDYDFYTRWGHKAMKTFVYDYWKDLQTRRAASIAEAPVATVTTSNK